MNMTIKIYFSSKLRPLDYLTYKLPRWTTRLLKPFSVFFVEPFQKNILVLRDMRRSTSCTKPSTVGLSDLIIFWIFCKPNCRRWMSETEHSRRLGVGCSPLPETEIERLRPWRCWGADVAMFFIYSAQLPAGLICSSEFQFRMETFVCSSCIYSGKLEVWNFWQFLLLFFLSFCEDVSFVM